MEIEYKPHLLNWTDEKVSRFWDFYNNYPHYEHTWFTEAVGDALLTFVKKYLPVHGKILDYGTGKGFLLQYILKKYSSVELYSCDFTGSIATQTGEKFNSQKQFRGCLHITGLPSVYENNFFDLVFLVETIEHLTDEYLHSTLKEIHRILKPGGIIVITTPNNESIQNNYVHCADCGATFHPMQHIRSWNEVSLRTGVETFGFGTEFCMATNLQWYKQKDLVHYTIDKLKKLFGKKYTPNLIYLGKKIK